MHVEFRILSIQNAHTFDPDTYHDVVRLFPVSPVPAAAGKPNGVSRGDLPGKAQATMPSNNPLEAGIYARAAPLSDQSLAALSHERTNDGLGGSGGGAASSQLPHASGQHPASAYAAADAHMARTALPPDRYSSYRRQPERGDGLSSRSHTTHSYASRGTGRGDSTGVSGASTRRWRGLRHVRSWLGWGKEEATPPPVLRLQFIMEGMTRLESSDFVAKMDADQPHYDMAEEIAAMQGEEDADEAPKDKEEEEEEGHEAVRRVARRNDTQGTSRPSHPNDSHTRNELSSLGRAHDEDSSHRARPWVRSYQPHSSPSASVSRAGVGGGRVHLTRCSVTPMEAMVVSIPNTVAQSIVKIRLVQLPPPPPPLPRASTRRASMSPSSITGSSYTVSSSLRLDRQRDSLSHTWRSSESGEYDYSQTTYHTTQADSAAMRQDALDDAPLPRRRDGGVPVSDVSRASAATAAALEPLCIGVGKVSFQKLMSSEGGVRIALQPKASLLRWMAQHYGMSAEEVGCMLGRSLGGSAFVMFQMVTYTFGRVPLSRLLIAHPHSSSSSVDAHASVAKGGVPPHHDFHANHLADHIYAESMLPKNATATRQPSSLPHGTLDLGDDMHLVDSEPNVALHPPHLSLSTTTAAVGAAAAARPTQLDANTLLTPELGDINSIVVRFTIIPYIALIDAILRVHHILMWHRPAKTMLLFLIVALVTISDFLGVGLLLAVLLQTILILRTALKWYHIPPMQHDGVSLISLLTAKTGYPIYLYHYRNYTINAMVRARLFFLHGLQGDCYYELVLLFHIMRRRQRRVYVVAAILVLVPVLLAVETVVVLSALAMFVGYPLMVYTRCRRGSAALAPPARRRPFWCARTAGREASLAAQQSLHMAHLAWIQYGPLRVVRVVQMVVEDRPAGWTAAGASLTRRESSAASHASWSMSRAHASASLGDGEVASTRRGSGRYSKTHSSPSPLRHGAGSRHVRPSTAMLTTTTTTTSRRVQRDGHEEEEEEKGAVAELNSRSPQPSHPWAVGDDSQTVQHENGSYTLASYTAPPPLHVPMHSSVSPVSSPRVQHTRHRHTAQAAAVSSSEAKHPALERAASVMTSSAFSPTSTATNNNNTTTNSTTPVWIDAALCVPTAAASSSSQPWSNRWGTQPPATAATAAAIVTTTASSSHLFPSYSSSSTSPPPSRLMQTFPSSTALIGATLAFAVIAIQPRQHGAKPAADSSSHMEEEGGRSTSSSVMNSHTAPNTPMVDNLCTRLRRHREAVREVREKIRSNPATADDRRLMHHSSTTRAGTNASAVTMYHSSPRRTAMALGGHSAKYVKETLHLLSYLQKNYRLTSYLSHAPRGLDSAGQSTIRIDSMVQRDWLLSDCEMAGIAQAVMQMPPGSLRVVRVTDSPDCDAETRTLALLAASLLQGFSLPLFSPNRGCRGCAAGVSAKRANRDGNRHESEREGGCALGGAGDAAATTPVYAVVELMSESDRVARLPPPNPCPERLLATLESIWQGAVVGAGEDKPLALVTAKNLLSIISTYC